MDSQPMLLNVRDVSKMLSLSVRSIWKLASSGTMPRPIRLGRSCRWSRASLEAWLKDKIEGAGPSPAKGTE